MPIVLDETPACQHGSCANASDGQHLALSRQELQEKSPNLSLLHTSAAVPTRMGLCRRTLSADQIEAVEEDAMTSVCNGVNQL